MPWGQGRACSWADRGGMASRGGKSSLQLQNISQADIPEPPPSSSPGNMPTGQELRNDELYLKTHRTKDKEWICEKSKRVWDTFTKSIKKNVEGPSTPRDENGSEVGAIEGNMPSGGDGETDEEANVDNVVNLLQTLPDKQLLNTWIDAVRRPKRGKIYGLGIEPSFRDPLHVSSASSTAPAPTVTPQQIVETPEFEQILNRTIRAVMQEELEVTVRAVMSRMLGFPAARSNGSDSPSGLP